MNDKHPITPTPELVEQWWKDAQQANYSDGLPCWLNYVATQAARWGAGMALDACVAWVRKEIESDSNEDSLDHQLCTPLSPAAQAVLDAFYEGWTYSDDMTPSSLAAALRVASDWVVPRSINPQKTKAGCVKLSIRNRLQSLADELEGRNETFI